MQVLYEAVKMQVSHSVSVVTKNNKEKLSLWYNGKNTIIPAPINPYFYSKKSLDIPCLKKSEIEGIALSNYQHTKFYRYAFDTRKELVAQRTEETSENNIPFLLRCRIDFPDLYKKYKHTNDLKFLFLDIEQYVKPNDVFPTYDDRIISIAWCGNDRKIKTIYLNKNTTSDKKLLLKFIEEYKKINPDVLVVYNKTYDIPTILHRCERNKISTVHFSKNNVKPYIGGKEKISIEGVVIYDVFESTRKDQNLTGDVENFGLKPTSDYYGYKSVLKPIDVKKMYKYVGTKELVDYNRSDVERTLLLFDVYWDGIVYNANDLGLPLNAVAGNFNITDLGYVVIGDEFKKQGIISDGKNQQRYPDIFSGIGGNYEGALVGIDRKGVFEPIHKADFGCVDEKTEALTDNGWKTYSEITSNDKFITWNSITDKFEIEVPEKINIYDYDDDLIYSDSRHISMAVTPNHRMYYYKGRKFGKNKCKLDRNTIYVDEAQNLDTYIDVPISSILEGHTPEKYKNYIPLMAWIITEGGIGNDSRITLSQRKCVSLDDSISYLRNIIKHSKLKYTETKRKNRPDVEFHFGVNEGRLILSLMENDGKHIPNFIFKCDYETRKMFIQEMVYGDGVDYRKINRSNSMVYISSDKKLIDELQMLCVITGYRTTISDKYIDKRNGSSWYYVHIFKRRITGLRLNLLRPTKDKLYVKKHYKGKVWCPTTKNGTWVCRRDNKVHITGNSMYPTIMSDFNLSPDTTTLIRYEPYGKFKIIDEGEWFIYFIPDKILKKTMVIQVLKKPGFCAKLVERFLKERDEYKKKYKATDNKKYKAMSDNRKVKANGGIYGIQGSANHPFGFAPIAIATTGIGRECAQILIDVLEDLYPKSVIEWDTDGVYFSTKEFVKEKFYERFDSQLQETFKKDLKLAIDIDDYDKGFFYKAKNYVLQKGKTIIYHGTAMKARSKDMISKNLIADLAKAKLSREPTADILAKYKRLEFPLNDFAMSVTLGMHMFQYKNLNAIAPRLALQAKKYLGITPELGVQYHYVKTRSGYKLFDLSKINEIDRDYYIKEIDKIAKVFECESMVSVDKWL